MMNSIKAKLYLAAGSAAALGTALLAPAAKAAPTETFSSTDAGGIVDSVWDQAVPFVVEYLPLILGLSVLVGLVLFLIGRFKGAIRGR